MKAASFVAVFVVAAVCLTGCGSSAKKSAKKTAEAAVTEQRELSEQVVIEQLPAADEFEKIPDEAIDAFNYSVSELKRVCPVEGKTKRLYGYVGEETVADADCYVFCVYDQKKDETFYVGKIAKTKADDRLYLYDESLGYEIIETDDEPRWSETVTASYAAEITK
ncbi:MAG: hypothetical protein IJ571_00940 [Ruminococcus sp.]|nr:hypothetical protein [Ruminococcus sp.]